MSSIQRSQAGDYHKPIHPDTPYPRAALAYARSGWPVFPCKPGDKVPLITDWPNQATTDPDRIRRWWSKWPDANIGGVTGERSGLLGVDVDPDNGGIDSLCNLDDQGCKLPLTSVNRTGGGGYHHMLKYPPGSNIKNSAGKLGPGLDIRGEGGYVILPPSRTTGPYEVLHKRPLAKPPEWLLEALREPSRGSGGEDKGSIVPIKASVSPEGPAIPKSERNDTMYRIACSLRARGLDRDTILVELKKVNANRCLPPLETLPSDKPDELRKIATSAARHKPGNTSPGVSPEVLETLDKIEADIMRRDWPGMGGKSERDVMIVLVRLARKHGTVIPTGVRISAGVRTVALAASLSKRSLLDNRKNGKRVAGILSRLKAKGLLRSDNGMRGSKEAGAFVLLPAELPREKLHHSNHSFGLLASKEPGVACGATSRAPLSAPRLRWSKPLYEGLTRVGTLRRMGKTCGVVFDHLERAGGTMTLSELAGALGKSRPRDLTRNTETYRGPVARLEEAGVVECAGDTVSLTPNWISALNERREADEEIADHRRDMARYARESQAYRDRRKVKPSPHPANAGADGCVEDLEKLSPRPETKDLYTFLGGPIDTVRGPGRLWQAFSDQVGVVMDSAPDTVTFMDPSELVLPGVSA